MYKTILVSQPIEDGEHLLKNLEGKGFPISAAFWYYLDDDMRWRLIIASPTVDQQGSRKSYEVIIGALEELGRPPQLTVTDISVVSPTWPEFQDMRRTIESAGVARIKIAGTPRAPLGLAFEDFYIYRWNLS